MFERFTEGARRAVARARDEARSLRHGHIGTEHLLLGLLGDPGDGEDAASVLADAGVARAAVRGRIAVGEAAGDGGEPPFTERAKTVLELGLREAHRLGHASIGTGHLLLGLLREGGGRGAAVLADLDADPARLRAAVLDRLAAPAAEPFRPHPRPSTDRRLTAIEERLERIESLLAALADRRDRA
ncbi:Clp protease N-terminal domain-containing protein [Actinomadura atramentaria]|uniref:Clp protease N-terminal domain-containing protein n=1 Tax=Actinomadura atramentaria TaxID=1990 RepID=UPI0003A58DD8|nr:Clp protease N-terminal domain-containing protein [Actinomadura atramentaria]